LLRNLPFGAAVSPYVTALMGAVVAVLVGLLLTLGAQAIWSAAFQAALSVATGSVSSIGAYLTPDLVKLFMIEQRVPLTVQVAASDASGATANGAFSLPLTGLLLAPAIALTVGGYISAASDYTRQPRYAIVRGALISPVYAVALAIMALTSASTLQIPAGGATVSISVSADPLWAFLNGLLWGALFGALGGWVQVAGRRSLSAALTAARRSARPELYGAGMGALAAFALGVLGFMALAIALGALALVSQQATITPNPLLSLATKGASGSAVVIFAVMALALPAGAILLALTTGASLSVALPGVNQLASQTFSFTSVGSQLHYPLWYSTALIIPFIALLTGGRVSARAAGATGAGRALVAGALMSLPFSVLLTLMAALSGFNVQVTALDTTQGVSAAIAILPTFFISLLAAAVVGALGGLSEVTLPWLGKIPHWLALPLFPLSFLLSLLLDLITGSPYGARRSLARLYFYDGVALTILLALAGVALDFVNSAPNPTLPFRTLAVLDSVAAALLVGLPLLFFAGSAITALSEPLYDTELAAPAAPAAVVAPLTPVQPGIAYTYPPVYSQPVAGPAGYQAPLSTPISAPPPGYAPLYPAGYPPGYPAALTPPAAPAIPQTPSYTPVMPAISAPAPAPPYATPASIPAAQVTQSGAEATPDAESAPPAEAEAEAEAEREDVP
jgi:hypothetical protein